jgi:hypothetical protein
MYSFVEAKKKRNGHCVALVMQNYVNDGIVAYHFCGGKPDEFGILISRASPRCCNRTINGVQLEAVRVCVGGLLYFIIIHKCRVPVYNTPTINLSLSLSLYLITVFFFT